MKLTRTQRALVAGMAVGSLVGGCVEREVIHYRYVEPPAQKAAPPQPVYMAPPAPPPTVTVRPSY